MIPIQKQPILTLSKQLVTEKELHTYCTNGGYGLQSLPLCQLSKRGACLYTEKEEYLSNHKLQSNSAPPLL